MLRNACFQTQVLSIDFVFDGMGIIILSIFFCSRYHFIEIAEDREAFCEESIFRDVITDDHPTVEVFTINRFDFIIIDSKNKNFKRT